MKSYRTLALKELLSQKVTSILILIAVVLSTMMTTIVGQSIGVLSAMREQQAIAIGGNRYATFLQMNADQLHALEQDERLSYVGKSIYMGSLELSPSLTLGLMEYLDDTTMKYEGYKIGPVIRDIRKDKGLLIEEVAAKTGISVSTLGQVEQGGRNLSMKNLYMLMEVYETDANSLLAIDCTPDSLDSRLKRLPADKQDYLKKTFDFMIEQALKSA